ncbi:MAG: DUF4184 family protein [Steroidobacteraceae bacterium]
MPFTLAHPAAVLPLRHLRWLRSAPLVIGALVPDAIYYFPEALKEYLRRRVDTHSFTGSYCFDLPLGVALLVCTVLLREPLTVLLPARARWLCLNALEPFRQRHCAAQWLLAPLAIYIGIGTHLLWDSFTHGDGWAVQHIGVLSDSVTIGEYTGEVSHILQYLSSAVGLAIVAVWYLRLPTPATVHAGHAARRAHAGPGLLLVMGAALLIGGVEAQRYYSHSQGAIYRTLDELLTRSLAWFVLLDLCAGAIVTLEQRAARHPP